MLTLGRLKPCGKAVMVSEVFRRGPAKGALRNSVDATNAADARIALTEGWIMKTDAIPDPQCSPKEAHGSGQRTARSVLIDNELLSQQARKEVQRPEAGVFGSTPFSRCARAQTLLDLA